MLEIWNKPQHVRDVDNALARLAAALKVEGLHDLHFIINQAAAEIERYNEPTIKSGSVKDNEVLSEIGAGPISLFCELTALVGLPPFSSPHEVIRKTIDRIGDLRAEARVAKDPRDHAAQYLVLLRRFVLSNRIPRDLASRIRKAGEELGELGEAAVLSQYGAGTSDHTPDVRDVMSEAADLINVGIDMLMICAGDSPDSIDKVFPWLIYNLMEKAGKYDRGENRTGGRE